MDLCAGTGGWLITFNFFNGGPCFNVSCICCAHVFVITVAVAAATIAPIIGVLPMVVLAAAWIALVIAVAVTVVVAAVVRIVMLRRTLAFFSTSLGPALRLVATKVVAVVILDIALVTLLLSVCGKGFIRAILALLEHMSVIFVRDEMDDLVHSDRVASTVSSYIETSSDIVVRGGE